MKLLCFLLALLFPGITLYHLKSGDTTISVLFSSLPLDCPYPPVNRDPGPEVSSGDDHGVLPVIKDEADHICSVFLAPLLWRAVLRWYGLILNDRKDLD